MNSPRIQISLSTVWVSRKIWSKELKRVWFFLCKIKGSALKVVLTVQYAHVALRGSAQDSSIARILRAGGTNTNFSSNFLLLFLVEKHPLNLESAGGTHVSQYDIGLFVSKLTIKGILRDRFSTYGISNNFFACHQVQCMWNHVRI